MDKHWWYIINRDESQVWSIIELSYPWCLQEIILRILPKGLKMEDQRILPILLVSCFLFLFLSPGMLLSLISSIIGFLLLYSLLLSLLCSNISFSQRIWSRNDENYGTGSLTYSTWKGDSSKFCCPSTFNFGLF